MGGWNQNLNVFQKALILIFTPAIKIKDAITYQKNRRRGIWKWLKR